MKHITKAIALSLLINLYIGCQPKKQEQAQKPIATSDTDRMAWWHEARFGMFIHFGLYTVPSGIYNDEIMGRNWYAEWIRMQGNWPNGIPDEEYRNFAKQFNPKDFNADEWIRLAKEAGMKYFLITAKHHDGFALWPTKVSKYNVIDATHDAREKLL